MSFPNYTSIFSGASTQPKLAGGMAPLIEEYKQFKDAMGGQLNEENFLPFAIFMQQKNAQSMNDPANVTRTLEAMEGPLERMSQKAAGISAQKDWRSLVGNLATQLPDTITQALGAKFAYDQPVFNAIGASYNPNPYAYGVLNRRGGVA